MQFKAHSPGTLKGIKIEWDAPVEITDDVRAAMKPSDVDTMRAGTLARGFVVKNITYPRGTLAFRVAEAHEVFLQVPVANETAPRVAKVKIQPTWVVENDGTTERHRGTIGTEDDDERIDAVIAARAPGMSRARAVKLIEDGCVSVGGASIRIKNHRLHAGDVLELVIMGPSQG